MTEVGETPKIIVSYRRSDSAMAGRIFDRLVQHFGKTSLFIDIDNIPYGSDFRTHIDTALRASDLLIALVGKQWLGARTRGKSRIMNKTDPVRVELEAALKQGIAVLPVLLNDAKMPEPEQLPDGLKDFAYLNAADVESGRDFNVHVERLISAVEHILGSKARPPEAVREELSPPPTPAHPSAGARRKPPLRPLILGLAAALLLLLGGIAWYWLGPPLRTADSVDPSAGPQFCDSLKRVIAEAPTRFASILGHEWSGVWTARVQLPGWDNCVVRDWTDAGKSLRGFACSLTGFADAAEDNAKLDSVSNAVKACLGPDWTQRRWAANQQITFVYEAGPNDPTIFARTTYDESSKGWLLQLDVVAPETATPAPAPKQ